MNQKKYTNETLAKDFYRASIPYCGNPKTYQRMRNKIAEISSVDIADFFQEHGSLDNLPIEGIGEITKKMLETILTKGVEEAIQITAETKVGNIRSDFYNPKDYQKNNEKRNDVEQMNNEEHYVNDPSIKVSGKSVMYRGKITDK